MLDAFVAYLVIYVIFFFFQAEDGIRDGRVTGVQTCALPISWRSTTRGTSPCAGGRCARGGRGGCASPRRCGSPCCNGPPQWWRSEERRVGKECRARWWPDQEKKK